MGMRCRITIELLDHEGDPAVIEMDDCHIVEEAGIERRYDLNGEVKLSHNDQYRIEIKAWKGCETFEAFQPETTYDEVGQLA